MSAEHTGETDAIRNPKRGKAHRQFGHWPTTICRSDSPSGGRLFETLTERVPVGQTDPADRCVTCWGRPATSPASDGAS